MKMFAKDMFGGQVAAEAAAVDFEDVSDWDDRPLGRDEGHTIRLTTTGTFYRLHHELSGKGAGSEYVRPHAYSRSIQWVQQLKGDFRPDTIITPETDFVRSEGSGGSVDLTGTPSVVSCNGIGANAEVATVSWTHGLTQPNFVIQGYFTANSVTVGNNNNAVIQVTDGVRNVRCGWGHDTSNEEIAMYDSGGVLLGQFFSGGVGPIFSTEKWLELFVEGGMYAWAHAQHAANPDLAATYGDFDASAFNGIVIGDNTGTAQGRVDVRELFVGTYT